MRWAMLNTGEILAPPFTPLDDEKMQRQLRAIECGAAAPIFCELKPLRRYAVVDNGEEIFKLLAAKEAGVTKVLVAVKEEGDA
jgi:hypothetical protein